MLFMKLTLLKLYHAFLASPVFATATLFFAPLRKLVTDEMSFFSILAMALVIDLVIGMIKYWKLHKFSFRELVTGLMIKVLVAYGGMLMFLAFQSLDPGVAAQWFGLIAKFTVLLYPAGSAFANMYVITAGRFPPIAFMKKLKDFDEIATPTVLLIENEKSKNPK